MIQICEVGPRDGLQNERKIFSVEDRVTLITKLVETGVSTIEVASFVHEARVPQMAKAEDVVNLLPKKHSVIYAGLALNRKGVERALNTPINKLHLTLAVSNTFQQKNGNSTVSTALKEIKEIIRDSHTTLPVVVIISTAFGCPFEGEIPTKQLISMIYTLIEAGCTTIILGDTTGMASPYQVKSLIKLLKDTFPPSITFGMHFHNTRGLGLLNCYVAYEEGIRHFDASIGGLGGCPFAPKSTGNVCTEDLVHLFSTMHIHTPINLSKYINIHQWLEKQLNHPLPGLISKVF